jgi:glucose dehydrogenase
MASVLGGLIDIRSSQPLVEVLLVSMLVVPALPSHLSKRRTVPAALSWILLLAFAPLLANLIGCGSGVRAQSQQPVALTVKALNVPAAEDGQWVMAAKDYGSKSYSHLTDISTSNVKTLKLAWAFSTGTLDGHATTRLGKLETRCYLTTPYPNVSYALDFTKEEPSSGHTSLTRPASAHPQIHAV